MKHFPLLPILFLALAGSAQGAISLSEIDTKKLTEAERAELQSLAAKFSSSKGLFQSIAKAEQKQEQVQKKLLDAVAVRVSLPLAKKLKENALAETNPHLKFVDYTAVEEVELEKAWAGISLDEATEKESRNSDAMCDMLQRQLENEFALSSPRVALLLNKIRVGAAPANPAPAVSPAASGKSSDERALSEALAKYSMSKPAQEIQEKVVKAQEAMSKIPPFQLDPADAKLLSFEGEPTAEQKEAVEKVLAKAGATNPAFAKASAELDELLAQADKKREAGIVAIMPNALEVNRKLEGQGIYILRPKPLAK